MSNITTRAEKGSPLTHAEVDQNFLNLDADKAEKVELGKQVGRIDMLATSLVSTGIVDPATENFGLSYISPTGLGVRAITAMVFASDLAKVYRFPPVAVDLNEAMSLADGLYVKHVHITRDGAIEFLDQREDGSPTRAALGMVFLQVVDGVISMSANLPPVARPTVAAISAFERAKLPTTLPLPILPIGEYLFSDVGYATGECINWADRSSIHSMLVMPEAPLQMRRVHDGTAAQAQIPERSMTIDPTRRWNGAALVDIPASDPPLATVQRLLWSPVTGFLIQYGSIVYDNLLEAAKGIAVHGFYEVFPGDEVVEIARLAVTSTATKLDDPRQCVIRYNARMGEAPLGACQVIPYTASGVFSPPAGARIVKGVVIGGGGGGASGSVWSAGATSPGGAGGAGGARTEFTVDAAQLPSSCAVVVGVAGTGAPAAPLGAMQPGTDGGDSTVYIGNVAYTARGGAGATSAGTVNGPSGLYPGGAGGAGASSATPHGAPGRGTMTAITSSPGGGGPGGGGGGGCSAANEQGQGGAAAYSTTYTSGDSGPSGSGGAAGGGDGLDASAPGSQFSAYRYPGVSGGGGGGNLAGDGGDGGHGGGYGAGGGGGGGARLPNMSGRGGNGSPGVVIFHVYF